MPASFSNFASSVTAETAFTVLAAAKRLIAAGKDVIELEIGDSPFPTPEAAVEAGIQAIRAGRTHYGPSVGIPEFREAAADYVNREYGLSVAADNIIAGPGAKTSSSCSARHFSIRAMECWSSVRISPPIHRTSLGAADAWCCRR